MGTRWVAIFVCAGLLYTANAFAEESSPQSWTKADEQSLRQHISKSDVLLGTYLDQAGFPHKALLVPDEFVSFYRKSPIHCLTVLTDIVENGSGHDALVAFHFGNAGDEPQIAVPLFSYLSARTFDEKFGDGPKTYREFGLGILRRKIRELSKPKPATSSDERLITK